MRVKSIIFSLKYLCVQDRNLYVDPLKSHFKDVLYSKTSAVLSFNQLWLFPRNGMLKIERKNAFVCLSVLEKTFKLLHVFFFFKLGRHIGVLA
jgi:hypothetical protein